MAGLAGLLGVVYVAALVLTAATTSYDIWGALLVAPPLILLTLPLLRRAGRGVDPRVRTLLAVALVVKLLAAGPRYLVNVHFYDGVGDAFRYHTTGARLFDQYRQLTFPEVRGNVPGTGFIEIVTGLVYAVIDPTTLGGFVVFSWFGFLGLLLFWSAFRVAQPLVDPFRYGVLVFLLPSLVFWPSSIGKEAWMMLTLGALSYGAALLLTRGIGVTSLVWLGLGGVGTAMVRPHITVLAAAALVLAYAVRPARATSVFGPLGKGVGLVVLLVACLAAVTQAESYFGVSETEGESVASSTTAVIDEAAERTNKGGSAFEAQQVRNPAQLPYALVTVLFRPFLFEASGLTALVSALEGTLLLLLIVAARRRILVGLRSLRSSPYLAFCVFYTLLFVVAFSSFGNFGILTRQRVQVFPFVLVFLALPLVKAGVGAVAPGGPQDRTSRRDRLSRDRLGPDRPRPDQPRPIGPLVGRHAGRTVTAPDLEARRP